MKVFKLIFRNALRHKLRTVLTILGLALAVMAFGLIRTFITAWYTGAAASSPSAPVRSTMQTYSPLVRTSMTQAPDPCS